MIYWNDTIVIITNLFEITEKDLAPYLNVSPSILSKVKRGRCKPSEKFIPGTIYNKIFDTKSKNSLAYGKDDKDLLSTLHILIERNFPDAYNTMKNHWEDDYRSFVMHLLMKTVRDPSGKNKPVHIKNSVDNLSSSETPEIVPSAKTLTEADTTHENDITSPEAPVDAPTADVQTKADTKQEDDVSSSTQVSDKWNSLIAPLKKVHMPDEFYKGYEHYEIADFVELDPKCLIFENYLTAEEKPDGGKLIKNAALFVEHMEKALKCVVITGSNNLICKDIDAYIKSLREYVVFLLGNSPDPTLSPFTLDPAKTQGVEYKEITINEDQDLSFWKYDQEVYCKIMAEFERNATEHRTKLQSLYEKVTDVRSRWGGLIMHSGFSGL